MAQPNPAEWERVLQRLRVELGETAYRSWVQPISVERVAEGEGVLSLPTRFLRNWVEIHYADRLLALWRAENRSVTRLSLIVEPRVAAAEAAANGNPAALPA